MGRALAVGMGRGRPEVAGRLLIADAVPAAVEAAVADTGGRPATIAEAGGVRPGLRRRQAQGRRRRARRRWPPPSAPARVVLSVIAGWDLDRLSAAAPGCPLVRTMPNLAVRHGAGIVAVATRGVDEARAAGVADLLAPLGAVVHLPETLFPAATALAGSGPGLVAVVAEGLEEGAVAAGLGRAQAREMVAAVLAGTAALLSDGTDPAAAAPARQLAGGHDDRRRGRARARRGARPHGRRGARGRPPRRGALVSRHDPARNG